MAGNRILRVAAVVLALGLGACSTGYGYGGGFGGGYGGAQFGAYDNFYGDPYGWQSVPFGYVGQGFGWSNGYYYPGNGNFVYDRRGLRRDWTGVQQRFWQQRARRNGYAGGFGNPGLGRAPIIRQQQREIRQDRRDIRQDQLQIQRQQQGLQRQQQGVDRQQQRIERQQQRIQRQEQRGQRWQQRGDGPRGD